MVIHSKTISRIERALWSKPRLYRDLWRAVMGPAAMALYNERYLPWLRKGLRPFLDRRGRLSADGRAGDCNRILQRLREEAEYGGLFASFDRATEHHRAMRRQLALWRVVEPLLAGGETDGIERTWEELEQGNDLRDYLKAALRRERILLDRSPDLARAQEIAFSREQEAQRKTRKR
jgi:hypothetical protein